MTSNTTRRATMTVDELAHMLGVGPSTAGRLVRAGLIPSIRAGRRVLISRAVVDRILESGQWPTDHSDDLRPAMGLDGSSDR
ncbi:MAG: helix-turn-helix domain-containing protein [Chloroflexota bacterium]|nr:helix-turn-helix domain-containing protein [Chloroflexota bacterium]